jgi:hypothetical protein
MEGGGYEQTVRGGGGAGGNGNGKRGRGLHPSTFRLTVSAFFSTEGACRGYLGGV